MTKLLLSTTVKDLIFDSQEEDKKLAGVQNTLFRYSPEEAEESAVRFRKVEDPAKIEELENGPKVKVYRSMQEIDGQLYPPMSELYSLLLLFLFL